MTTINQIQTEMTAAGSRWWDKSNMRFFGCRVGQQVYQGEGGIYFVTSEKPPHGTRKYTVRQYKPDTKQVETVGDFCSMSRAQAHHQAAQLAGPSAIVSQEAHREPSEAEQLALDIQRGGGRASATSAAHLIRLASRHHKMMEDYCNGVDIYDDEDEPLPALADLRAATITAAKEHLCGVIFSGDPRGCTVKLVLPNGETNDWGKEGWCVPTR